jgi:hypothetical protein
MRFRGFGRPQARGAPITPEAQASNLLATIRQSEFILVCIATSLLPCDALSISSSPTKVGEGDHPKLAKRAQDGGRGAGRGDHSATPTAHRVRKNDVFGNRYTQNYDKDGNKSGCNHHWGNGKNAHYDD